MFISHFAVVHNLSKMKRLELTYFSVVLTFLTVSQGNNISITRSKRYLPLIFQNPAAITYITGFGIPVNNLNPELVTVGMVFKAQQFLPPSYEAIRHQANHTIHKRQYFSRTVEERASNTSTSVKNSRVMFYKALELLSISLGQAGRDCVLKMICEVAAMPFHYMNGVLGEIVHILLTPSSSVDTSSFEGLDNTYLNAERNGQNHLKYCAKLYTDCNESILDVVTNIFD